jgi:5-methylcytosine-specific restriction endonuclease McrA
MNSLPGLYPESIADYTKTTPKFQPNQPAEKVDSALKSALKIKDAAHQCSLDWFAEILNRKLFRELGYSSINQYAREELGFSNSKIGDYISLTRKLEKLPHLKDSLTRGKLGYTKGRLLAGVVDEKSEKQWVGFAEVNTRKRVEEEVERAKEVVKDSTARQSSFLPGPARKTPAAVVPVRVNLEMSPSQFARYEAIWEKLRKQRNVASEKVEALLEIMASFLGESFQKTSPRGDVSNLTKPSAQIHIHHCPECESSTIQTSKGALEIGKTEYERYQCDCQTSLGGGRNTTSIAPSVRREIFAQARHKCQTPGCIHTGYLEIHHIEPRARGGSNDPGNLRCLCSACHHLIHAQSSGFMVKAPTEVYSWPGGTNNQQFQTRSFASFPSLT